MPPFFLAFARVFTGVFHIHNRHAVQSNGHHATSASQDCQKGVARVPRRTRKLMKRNRPIPSLLANGHRARVTQQSSGLNNLPNAACHWTYDSAQRRYVLCTSSLHGEQTSSQSKSSSSSQSLSKALPFSLMPFPLPYAVERMRSKASLTAPQPQNIDFPGSGGVNGPFQSSVIAQHLQDKDRMSYITDSSAEDDMESNLSKCFVSPVAGLKISPSYEPKIHKLVHSDHNHLMWDVRKLPSNAIWSNLGPYISPTLEPVLCPSSSLLIGASCELPWLINVTPREPQSNKLCIWDLLCSLHRALHTPVTSAEIETLNIDGTRLSRLYMNALKRQLVNDEGANPFDIRRVDFLDENVFFRGIFHEVPNFTASSIRFANPATYTLVFHKQEDGDTSST